MGFTDEQFEKAQTAGISKTQLYKQAGNSIVVNVLSAIFDNLFSDVQEITMNELFSGIGSQITALKNIGKNATVVGISEIDEYAIKSYNAIHGETRNYGDISKVKRLDYADFWTYSSPCTDISLAGKQQGLIKGVTRSGLLYEVERLLNVAKKENNLPKYLMFENVKNILSNKFKGQFVKWLEYLESLGYNNYWQVINAKDYIPQNRERVFVISIRKDIDNGFFSFPQPSVCSNKKLIDYMELDKHIEDRYWVHKTWTPNVIMEMTQIYNETHDKELAISQVIKKHNNCVPHQQDMLQSAYGICRCIPAGTHGSTPHLLKTVYWVDDE